MPEQNEVEKFWRAFAEKVRGIEGGKLGKRPEEADGLRQQAKDPEALGKIAAKGALLFQGEAGGIMDEEIERAGPGEGFTLEGHLRSERDHPGRRANLDGRVAGRRGEDPRDRRPDGRPRRRVRRGAQGRARGKARENGGRRGPGEGGGTGGKRPEKAGDSGQAGKTDLIGGGFYRGVSSRLGTEGRGKGRADAAAARPGRGKRGGRGWQKGRGRGGRGGPGGQPGEPAPLGCGASLRLPGGFSPRSGPDPSGLTQGATGRGPIGQARAQAPKLNLGRRGHVWPRSLARIGLSSNPKLIMAGRATPWVTQ
jgi:hypothetical protein